jgi:hypothetical protein
MKTIQVSNNENLVMVDDEDYPILSRYTWNIDPKGYVVTNLNKTTIRMHRFILNPPKDMQIDHINGIKHDNRKCNLRLATNTQNQRNTFKRKRETSSKYKGVHWRKDMGKWASRIAYEGKRIYLGYYDDETEAAEAYNMKALELFGEFANLNKIERG